MKKCSICGEWVDSFNGVTQYDDDTPVFICDCCFLQTESGQELLANVTAAQPALALDAPHAAYRSKGHYEKCRTALGRRKKSKSSNR